MRAAFRNTRLEFPIQHITEAGLIGGDGVPHPREISLARHDDMLFLHGSPGRGHGDPRDDDAGVLERLARRLDQV